MKKLNNKLIKLARKTSQSAERLLFGLYERIGQANNHDKEKDQANSKINAFHILRIVFLLAMIAISIRLVYARSTQLNSLQGFINGDMIELRAPVRGRFFVDESLTVGSTVKAGQKLGQIEGEYSDLLTNLNIKKQEILSRLEADKKMLESLYALTGHRQSLASRVQGKNQVQNNLRVKLEQARLKQQQKDLAQTRHSLALTKKNHQRMKDLAAEGFLPEIEVDQLATQLAREKEIINSQQALIQQSQARIQAAENGVLIDGNQASNYQEIKYMEMRSEVIKLQRQAAEVKLKISLTEAELQRINQEIKLHEHVDIIAKDSGVIWSIPVESGELIDDNQIAFKIINCQKRWVEAFIPEGKSSEFYIGAPVEIKSLNADKESWSGRIESIRSGVSRVQIGEDESYVPSEKLRKQVSFRVDVDWGEDKSQSQQFCQLGSSVRLKFVKARAK